VLQTRYTLFPAYILGLCVFIFVCLACLEFFVANKAFVASRRQESGHHHVYQASFFRRRGVSVKTFRDYFVRIEAATRLESVGAATSVQHATPCRTMPYDATPRPTRCAHAMYRILTFRHFSWQPRCTVWHGIFPYIFSRQSRLSEFNNNKFCRVLVVSITAGGQGLDFTAASNGVFVELPESPAWLRQAEDRLHRRRQVRKLGWTFWWRHMVNSSLPQRVVPLPRYKC